MSDLLTLMPIPTSVSEKTDKEVRWLNAYILDYILYILLLVALYRHTFTHLRYQHSLEIKDFQTFPIAFYHHLLMLTLSSTTQSSSNILWLDSMNSSSKSLDISRSDTCNGDSTILGGIDGVLYHRQ